MKRPVELRRIPDPWVVLLDIEYSRAVRRALAICALLAGGCGRLGFDARPDARDDAHADAPFDASLGPPRVVQHASDSRPNAISVSVALTASVVAGDVLVVATSTTADNGTPTVMDSQGDLYTLEVTDAQAGEAAVGLYVATAQATAATTVTCRTGVVDNVHCHVYELAGTTGIVETTGMVVQVGPALTVSPASATTRDNDYVLAFFVGNNSSATFTADPSYGDAEYTPSSSNDVAFSEGRLAPIGPQTATATAVGSGAVFVELIAALAPAGAAAR